MAAAPNGDAVVGYRTPGTDRVSAVRYDASEDEWGAPQAVSPAGRNTVFVNLVAADNKFVLAWQDFDDENPYGTAAVRTTMLPFDSDAWTEPQHVLDAGISGVGKLGTNAAGDVMVMFIKLESMSSLPIATRTLPAGSTEWTPVATVPGSNTNPMGVGDAAAVLTASGDEAIFWPDSDEGRNRTGFSVRDGSAPVIDGIDLPSSAKVGSSVDMSVDAYDAWSSVADIDWDFGDGGVGNGASDSHVFTAAGTYEVSVTVTDSHGHESTGSRNITVSAASTPQPPVTTPADDDDDEDTVVDDVKPPAKPPVTNAPVIEAKLAGKTITYSTKVSLKKGQSCSGKVQASFTFGNKRYKSNLKLKKVGSACRATGKTTLKKTPSARTKITVKITGKQVKSRSLATKRG